MSEPAGKLEAAAENDKVPEKTLIQVEGLHKYFKTAQETLKVLKGICFEVAQGEMLVILGRSGSGKSTLLHLLGGLDKPTLGTIRFRGNDLSKANDREISKYRSREVGFVFQFYHLLPELTLFENVVLPNRMAGKAKKSRVEYLLERMGLAERRRHYPAQLSGGERQRAAIARALINDPALVLCDEPTGNLDEETAASVFDLLASLNRDEKKTFIIVTHELMLADKANSILQLRDGILERRPTLYN